MGYEIWQEQLLTAVGGVPIGTAHRHAVVYVDEMECALEMRLYHDGLVWLKPVRADEQGDVLVDITDVVHAWMLLTPADERAVAERALLSAEEQEEAARAVEEAAGVLERNDEGEAAGRLRASMLGLIGRASEPVATFRIER